MAKLEGVKTLDMVDGHDFEVIGVQEICGYTNADNLEKLTDDEVKFANIGRKPGEFKKGDIVADGTGDAMFTVLSDHEIESGCVSFPERIYRNIDEVELIAPVESRVDVG